MKHGAAKNGPRIRRFLEEESGTSFIEYALLASCIAVVIAATVSSAGSNLRDNFYKKLADAMPG